MGSSGWKVELASFVSLRPPSEGLSARLVGGGGTREKGVTSVLALGQEQLIGEGALG